MPKTGSSRKRPIAAKPKSLTQREAAAIVDALRRAATGAIGGAPHKGKKPQAARVNPH
jgi:hypothetical protein